MSDDLVAARQWVDDWESGLVARAERATALSVQLARLRSTVRDPAGRIEVTVGSSGSIIDLRLDEAIRHQPASETARQIMATIRSALADLTDQISQVTAEAYGPGNPTGQSIVDSYRPRLDPDR